MKSIKTEISKTYLNIDDPMPARRADGKQILLLNEELENFLLGFADKGQVEITIQIVQKSKRTKK